jgi:hypothetical protein
MRKSMLCSAFIFAILVAGLTISISLGETAVYAQQPLPQPSSIPQFPTPFGPGPFGPGPFGPGPFGQRSNFTFGVIASIQNNQSGQPAWLVAGHWRGNLLSFNQTTNATAQNGSNNASSLAAAVFNADMRMVMLNGSGGHTHVITNFRLSNVSSDRNGTVTYVGNSTISLRDGPVVGVPTTIKVSGEIISIFPDPSKVKEHFGNTPIYGLMERGPDHNMRRLMQPPLAGPPPFP